MKKKLLLTLVAFSIIQGCASTTKPLTEEYKGLSASFETTDATAAYGISIDCAMQKITSPVNGQFFTFQSDKLNKWSVTYKSSPITAGESLGSPLFYDVRASMNFGIRKNTVQLDIKNIRVAFTGSYYGANQGVPSYSAVSTQEQANALDVSLKPMLDSMLQCLDEI